MTVKKSLRFEVFKRDSFKCQYCGAAAPDVLLHLDHIVPQSKGGSDDITNLVTACEACNLGKSDRSLDENAAVKKSRNQLEMLQERREQLEMLMQWREGLRDLTDETVERLCHYWESRAPGWSVNDIGKRNVRKWLRKFAVEELATAMDVAADQYLDLDREGKCTSDSWEEGFSKIPGICRVTRAEQENPGQRELYYIRGILRNRLRGYLNEPLSLDWLEAARSWGVSLDELRETARRVTTWSEFSDELDELIDNQKRNDASAQHPASEQVEAAARETEAPESQPTVEEQDEEVALESAEPDDRCFMCGEDSLDEACEAGICLRCQRQHGYSRFGESVNSESARNGTTWRPEEISSSRDEEAEGTDRS